MDSRNAHVSLWRPETPGDAGVIRELEHLGEAARLAAEVARVGDGRDHARRGRVGEDGCVHAREAADAYLQVADASDEGGGGEVLVLPVHRARHEIGGRAQKDSARRPRRGSGS